ncbi:rRNA maturation RNase YbeY [Candidatus Gottesmanbacteria bacterium]|nr:rRNA maturation RNase YbeY [Candidatus Gottesmanbacteria bacterium]
MRNLLIFVESRFPIDRARLKKTLNTFLDTSGIKGDVEVSVAVVGDRKMRNINEKFHKESGTTTILSFAQAETTSHGAGFVEPPDGILRLGDIIISYPQAVERAAEENMLVDDKVDELLIHGLNNLLGKEESGLLS